MTQDPICGMTVDEATALRAERDGEAFYFCSDHCRTKFLAQSHPVSEDSHQHMPVGEEHSCCGGKAGEEAHRHEHHSHHQGDMAVTASTAAKFSTKA